MKNKLSISSDLLGIVVFLSRKLGPHVGQDGSVWFLREVHDQLEANNIENYLVSLAMDCIGYPKTVLLREYVKGNAKLTTEQDRFFRDSGFLYGAKPKLPKAVIKWCKKRDK